MTRNISAALFHERELLYELRDALGWSRNKVQRVKEGPGNLRLAEAIAVLDQVNVIRRREMPRRGETFQPTTIGELYQDLVDELGAAA